MALPREVALDENQIDEIMSTQWNLRIASHGPGERINLTPMYYGWSGGKVYFFGRGQKIVNMRRNPNVSVIVDRNELYPELQAVMIQGQAQVLEDAAAEEADLDLPEARIQMGRKYTGSLGRKEDDPPPNPSTSGGRNRRWVVITPDRVVTWDNTKLDRIGGPPKR